jgi:CubicO group peptidase (beta-lactamase class C family)
MRNLRKNWSLIAMAMLTPMTGGVAMSQSIDPRLVLDSEANGHIAATAAHHLCSGMFVVGRDHQRTVEEVLSMDIARFPDFRWSDEFEYAVDMREQSATVWGPDFVPARKARYQGDQGCTILPVGFEEVFFEPLDVVSNLPDPATQQWPLGDVNAHGTFVGVDQLALDAALNWAMLQDDQNTRALVIAYRGKIIGERYAEGFGKNTPQLSWSQGKSITAALVGVLAEQGEIDLDEPAPVIEWQGPDDPRKGIKVRDLLNMSSGLDFHNYDDGGRIDAWSASNEHSRIYFDGINVFELAINQPLDISPGTQFRYRNSDPLALGKIVREKVEARGERYLHFPQTALFDRIGARNFVLETDAWGNFIMTGYDYGSAWDWVRFGLLFLWDGVFEGDRVLAEDWVKFVRTPAPGDPTRNYGGLFWLNRSSAMDRVPEDAFWSSGYMGQRTVIIPSADMVVVRLGPSSHGSQDYMNELIGQVLDAIDPVHLD